MRWLRVDNHKTTLSCMFGMGHENAGNHYYSGRKLTINNVSLDHKHPLTAGGDHSISNVVLCTKSINRMKGQLTEDEFLAMCEDVAKTAKENRETETKKYFDGSLERS